MLIGHSLADEEGLLIAVDTGVCEIMQREERELLGMSFKALTHPDDRERNVAALSKLGIHDGPLSIRKRYVRPDGSSVWSSVRVSRLRTLDGERLVGTIELLDARRLTSTPERLWRSAKQVDALIRARRVKLGNDLFSDFAWVILLQLYLAEVEGRELTILEIADRCDVWMGLAARWVNVLEQKNLVERSEWTEHAPQLTGAGLRKVEQLLDCNAPY